MPAAGSHGMEGQEGESGELRHQSTIRLHPQTCTSKQNNHQSLVLAMPRVDNHTSRTKMEQYRINIWDENQKNWRLFWNFLSFNIGTWKTRRS